MSVVGGVFDERSEDYSLFPSWGEVVVLAGLAVSWIFDVDGVEKKGIRDVGNVADKGMRQLVLLIITTSISIVVINLTIFIIVLLDDGC